MGEGLSFIPSRPRGLKNMKPLLSIILLFTAIAAKAAVFSTNVPDKDAFVRALAPESNYGGAGALSVSGTNAASGNPTNGAFDSFMSFNTAAMVTNFNSSLGTTNWVITSATLNLTENPAPGNSIFNYGTGLFEIRWIANDTWIEGTGNPMNPTTNGITYDEEPDYLNASTDVSLGQFYFAGTNVFVPCPLALASKFVNNMQAGGEVGFFLTAIDPSVGFLFYSRNYAGNPAVLPHLVVSAAAPPVISGLTVSGANLVLSASNGVAGGTCRVLTSTNITAPLNEWTPMATNILAGNGNFTITLTNAANLNAACPQFFILQTD